MEKKQLAQISLLSFVQIKFALYHHFQKHHLLYVYYKSDDMEFIFIHIYLFLDWNYSLNFWKYKCSHKT